MFARYLLGYSENKVDILENFIRLTKLSLEENMIII